MMLHVTLPLRTCPICGTLTSSAPGDRVTWYQQGPRPRMMIVHAACATAVRSRKARPRSEWRT